MWFRKMLQKLSTKSNGLAGFKFLPIGSKLGDAFALYGMPDGAIFDGDDDDGGLGFIFYEDKCPEVRVWCIPPNEIEGDEEIEIDAEDLQVGAVIYYSNNRNPAGDLQAVFDFYSEGHSWREVNQGYLYFRDDDELRVTCSVMPIIGVLTKEYAALTQKSS